MPATTSGARAAGAGHRPVGEGSVVVAVDAGTTGVRSLAVDRAGAVVDVAYRELTQHFPRPGWVEHDPLEISGAVVATLVEVGARLAGVGRGVAAVGIANQRETALAWDRSSGRPRHRAIVWQDRRTTDRCRALEEAGHLPTVRDRTGLVLDPYFSATKYAWLLDEAGVGDGLAPGDLALGTVDSWLLWHLTGGTDGGVFATDPTNASRTLLFDTGELAWSGELCDLFGVPVGALAVVRPSCGRFGELRGSALSPGDDRAATAAARLLDGVPISGIAGDQQAALFGQACFEPGMAKVTYGTGSFVLLQAGPDRPGAVDGLVTSVAWDLGAHGGPAGPVAYALEGSTFASGAAIQWLRDGLGLIERAEEIGPLAESVPDAGGVTVVPAFTGLGSPWWDPGARGTVTGITRGTGPPQIARAVVEAMAFQVRDIVEAMTAAGATIAALRADGGAAAMELLLAVQADQIGVPVARPRCVESTAVGAATLAGLAEGFWPSLDELAALWVPDVERRPAVERALADHAYAAWRRAVDRSRAWVPTPRPAPEDGARRRPA
jgi:glycerol kinase